MRTRTLVIIVTIVIFVSFGISTFSSIVSLSSLIENNCFKEAGLFTSEIQGEIEDSFLDSVQISETINNTYVRDFIENRDNYTDNEASQYFGRYLEDIKRRYGYDTAFLVIEPTREYFTEYGRMKVLDTIGEDDSWYSNFKEKNEEMELNIDNDQANGNRITVYNNIRMLDESGRFVGVCGVGHTLRNLNSTIDELEQRYGLSIALADKDGIITVAGDDSLPGTEIKSYIKDYIDGYDAKIDYEYEQIGTGGYIVVKYIPGCNWYLCLESPEKLDDMTKIILYNLLAALVSLAIMVLIISVAMKFQEQETLEFKADSETDMMTGLYNRRAFDNMLDSIRNDGNIRDISVVIVDVNGLKQVNDQVGHTAGDELITKTAECINELYGNHGRAFRIGGDEFAIVITEPVDDVDECVKTIKSRVAQCKLEHSEKLAVAVGIVRGEDYQGRSVDELLEIADKAMYSDKEAFYRDKRHERRGR